MNFSPCEKYTTIFAGDVINYFSLVMYLHADKFYIMDHLVEVYPG